MIEDNACTVAKAVVLQGLVVLPRSSKANRICATAPPQLLSAAVPADAMHALNACDNGTKFCWNPRSIET